MQQPPPLNPPVPRSNWPSTLGIFAIIFGILGFLSSAYNLSNTLMMRFMGGSMFPAGSFSSGATGDEAEALEKAMEDAMTQMMTDMQELAKVKVFADGGMLVLSILLFTGGILLMQRFRVSKIILLIFSYAKLVIGSWTALLTQKMISQMGGSMGAVFNVTMEEATSGSSPAPPPVDMVRICEIGGMIALVVLVIWSAILPVIFIIWFAREQTKWDMDNGYGWK